MATHSFLGSAECFEGWVMGLEGITLEDVRQGRLEKGVWMDLWE